MKMDVPAEVIFAEFQIEFGARVDDVIEGVEAEGFGFAELAFEVGIFDAATQSPDGVDKGKARKFKPGRAEIPDFVIGRSTKEIYGGVANEKDVGEVGGGFVAGKRDEFRIQIAFGEE